MRQIDSARTLATSGRVCEITRIGLAAHDVTVEERGGAGVYSGPLRRDDARPQRRMFEHDGREEP